MTHQLTVVKNQPLSTGFNKVKATIYKQGIFGIQKIECQLVRINTGVKYAQYKNAAEVVYVPKRKRTAYMERLTYDPFMIILEGHNHPDTENGFVPMESNIDGVKCTQSKYTCFSDSYKSDFLPSFEAYLIANNITPIFNSIGLETY
jgi:hypothetical protein